MALTAILNYFQKYLYIFLLGFTTNHITIYFKNHTVHILTIFTKALLVMLS